MGTSIGSASTRRRGQSDLVKSGAANSRLLSIFATAGRASRHVRSSLGPAIRSEVQHDLFFLKRKTRAITNTMMSAAMIPVNEVPIEVIQWSPSPYSLCWLNELHNSVRSGAPMLAIDHQTFLSQGGHSHPHGFSIIALNELIFTGTRVPHLDSAFPTTRGTILRS
jgi:hypothetical protein